MWPWKDLSPKKIVKYGLRVRVPHHILGGTRYEYFTGYKNSTRLYEAKLFMSASSAEDESLFASIRTKCVYYEVFEILDSEIEVSRIMDS